MIFLVGWSTTEHRGPFLVVLGAIVFSLGAFTLMNWTFPYRDQVEDLCSNHKASSNETSSACSSLRDREQQFVNMGLYETFFLFILTMLYFKRVEEILPDDF